MKKFLLLILATVLCSANAIAETWTIPPLDFTSLVSGDTLYLYNVNASAFLNVSSDKRTCTSKSGMAVIANLTVDNTAYNLLCSTNGKDFTYLYTSDAQTSYIGGVETTLERNWTIKL